MSQKTLHFSPSSEICCFMTKIWNIPGAVHCAVLFVIKPHLSARGVFTSRTNKYNFFYAILSETKKHLRGWILWFYPPTAGRKKRGHFDPFFLTHPVYRVSKKKAPEAKTRRNTLKSSIPWEGPFYWWVRKSAKLLKEILISGASFLENYYFVQTFFGKCKTPGSSAF